MDSRLRSPLTTPVPPAARASLAGLGDRARYDLSEADAAFVAEGTGPVCCDAWSAASNDRHASANHDATGGSVHPPHDACAAQKPASSGGKDHMPADDQHFNDEDHRCQRSEMAERQ